MPFIQHNGATVAFVAGAEILPHRIVKFGAADNTVVQASAAADLSIGVSYVPNSLDDPTLYGQPPGVVKILPGDTVEVVTGCYPRVEFGGTVPRGAAVTSDAQGRAIAAATGNQILGFAGFSAVVGDIGPVLIHRSIM